MRVSIDDNILKNIGNSIRTKTGNTDLITPQNMASEIDSIPVANLQSKSVTITSNGTESVVPDTGYTGLSEVNIDTNVSFDITEYLGNSVVEPPFNVAGALLLIKKIPEVIITTRSVSNTFASCSNLTEVGVLDFGSVTSLNLVGFFNKCTNLQTVNFRNVRADMLASNSLSSMFGSCPSLTDQTLENILDLCITVKDWYSSSNKKLTHLGFTATNYPVSRLETLSNYQAFLDAGWTTGY